MEIVENLDAWQVAFSQGWLAQFEKTGKPDWNRYPKIENRAAPPGPAINLGQSRLALISSAGAYLADSQEPFDAPNPLGDYGIRLFPSTIPVNRIAYAHDHFDHTAVIQDHQVLLPLQHLADMVVEGEVGELAPSVISFMGYQPDAERVVIELIPTIVDVALTEQIDAALLVPA